MKKTLLIFLILFSCCFLFAQEENTEYDNIYLYTTWDSNYLYVACEAQCPDIKGKNVQYNAPIGDDDGLEIVCDISHSLKKSISPSCFSFKASVAGGFEFCKGDITGKWVKENIFSHKIAANVTGSLNNSTNIDTGFVIELAIPWDKITDQIPENKTVSFSYRVKCGGKEYSLTDPKHFYDPSTWYDMVLNSYTSIFANKIKNRIICGTYLSNAPTIDGQIKKGEWSTKQRSNIKIPIDKNIYALNFRSQKIIAKDLELKDSSIFLFSPKREDVIKEAIISLEPIDAVNVRTDENLSHIFEAVKAYCTEKNTYLPIVPRITAYSQEELTEKLKYFISVVPYQFRLIVPNENAEKTLFIKTNFKDINYDSLKEEFPDINISAKTDYAANSRIVSEYAYIITNLATPKSISLNTPQQIRFAVKNVGSATWKPLEMCLTYRWFRNMRFYSQGFAPIPITAEVKPGETYIFRTVLMPVSASDKPLPTGDVTVEAELVRSDGEKLITSQSILFQSEITETNSASPLYAIGLDMTGKMEAGSSYNAVVEVLNSTDHSWKFGDEIFADLVMTDGKGNVIKEYPKDRNSLFVYEDTPAGIIGSFRGLITFKSKEPKPLNGNYELVFSTKNKKEYIPFYRTKITLIEKDYNQKLILANNPGKIVKNSSADLKIIVRNAGNKTWRDAKLVANWFNERGQLTDNGGFEKIAKGSIKPGKTYMKEMSVFTPDRPGKYYLVVSVNAEGQSLNTIDADRANDIISVPLNVEDK